MVYATDRRQTDREMPDTHHRLMPPPYGSGGIITLYLRMPIADMHIIIFLNIAIGLIAFEKSSMTQVGTTNPVALP